MSRSAEKAAFKAINATCPAVDAAANSFLYEMNRAASRDGNDTIEHDEVVDSFGVFRERETKARNDLREALIEAYNAIEDLEGELSNLKSELRAAQ